MAQSRQRLTNAIFALKDHIDNQCNDIILSQLILDIDNIHKLSIKTCKYWKNNQICPFGNACQFNHKFNQRCKYDTIGCYAYSNDQCNHIHHNTKRSNQVLINKLNNIIGINNTNINNVNNDNNNNNGNNNSNVNNNINNNNNSSNSNNGNDDIINNNDNNHNDDQLQQSRVHQFSPKTRASSLQPPIDISALLKERNNEMRGVLPSNDNNLTNSIINKSIIAPIKTPIPCAFTYYL